MKTKIIIFAILILPSFGILAPDVFRGTGGYLYAQTPDLLDNSWFVYRARNSNESDFIWHNSTMTLQELRFELTFLDDKIIMTGCCGGVFEMDVNHISSDELEIINLVEIETTLCNETFVSAFYDAIKGSFTSLIGETITFTIQNSSFHSGVKNIIFNHPSINSFVEFSNTPVDLNGTAPYYGHEPPTHIWSLTQVQYEGQTFELPYGAALTVADIYEGTFTISLCGEIFAAINSSWELDVEVFEGPCFISCGILENTAGVCEPVEGYDESYLENFKQNVFDFLNDNSNQTMGYKFTFGSARKLIIKDYSNQNKLIFYSNDSYLNTTDHNLSEFKVYPNPVSEILYLESGTHEIAKMSLYDINGKLLQTLDTSIQEIVARNLNNGLYFLVLESATGETVVRKFLKR